MTLLDYEAGNIDRVGDRFVDTGGQKCSWMIRYQGGSATPHGESMPYIDVARDSATAKSAPPTHFVSFQIVDEPNRAVDPVGLYLARRQEFNDFIQSDIESDIWEADTGSNSQRSAFLGMVYDLERKGDVDHAIDVIFEYVNNLLVDGRFDICDRILAEVDLARISPVLMVSFLTITAAAKPKLKNRDRFFRIVRRVVARQRGEKAAGRLLDGLD